MKIKYIDKRFSPQKLQVIDSANKIIAEYEDQGFDLTLRQLYYQFVSRDLIPNSNAEYKKLGVIVNDARLAGLISWRAIVDRTRTLRGNIHTESPNEAIRNAANDFVLDKWEGQSYRVEVWIEKDALVGVIEQICVKLDVDFFSCRGYTSQSEMWAAGKRLQRYNEAGQSPVIIHLGDHDPSGIDMTRDIEDRLNMFIEGPVVEVNRIALNMDQVRKYHPPPNPAKITDTRAGSYIRVHGRKSWELDALDPSTLEKLIEKTVKRYRQDELFEKKKTEEQEHRLKLLRFADEYE